MRPQRLEFLGAEGNRLAADLWEGRGHTVVFLHGGGQTRHAWDLSARRLAEAGMRAINVDLRGHGQSDWMPSGRYGFADFSEDAHAVLRQVGKHCDGAPSLVGASLGGLAALGAQIRHGPRLQSLVLVDVTPRMDPEGVARILGFMGARMEDGFPSLAAAAEAIASYLPYRKRPQSLSGLRKNLRRCPDGRFRWHWDPAFVTGPGNITLGARVFMDQLMAGLPRLDLPLLLVRGMQSELVHEAHAREFVALAPQASYVDVGGAGHMVAGDRNDVFCAHIETFLARRQVV